MNFGVILSLLDTGSSIAANASAAVGNILNMILPRI